MKSLQAIQILRDWGKKGYYVFTKHELAKLFYQDKDKTLVEGLNRLVKKNILRRVCRNIYVNENAHSFDTHVIEKIAQALRRGQYSYVSLESMLSEYGVISQAPIDRLTVMTTGRSGVYKTPYGVIEFTHTKRSLSNIMTHVRQLSDRPLRIATKEAAWRDLKRVGRNIAMVNMEEIRRG